MNVLSIVKANYTQVHYTVKVTGNIKITIKYYTVQVTNLRGPSDCTILKLQSSTSYTCSASYKFKEIQVTPRIGQKRPRPLYTYVMSLVYKLQNGL